MQAPLAVPTSVAGKMLGVSDSHIRRMAKQGVLPFIRLGHRMLIPVGAIESLVGATVAPVATPGEPSRPAFGEQGRQP